MNKQRCREIASIFNTLIREGYDWDDALSKIPSKETDGYLSKSSVKRYIRSAARDHGILVEEYEEHSRTSIENNHSNKDHQNPNKIEFEEEGNKAKLTSESTRIKTLDQLIEAAEIDLDIWEIERHVINKWEVGAKNEYTQKIEPEPLWQVKCWLKRKVLVKQKFKPVTPIRFDVDFNKPDGPIENQLNTAVIIPDTHIGYRRDTHSGEMKQFHDRRVLDLALQIIQFTKPHFIILLGDMLDMPEWTKKFRRSHEFARTTQASLNELAWWIVQMRDLAEDAKMIYLQGNHESRIPKYLQDNNKAAYKLKQADAVEKDHALLSVPSLLGLDKLQVQWIGGYPDNRYWINDNLVVHHGNRSSTVSGKSAGQVLGDARASQIFGHCHRLELATKTTYPKKGPTSYQSITLGTGAKLGGLTPGQKQKQDWQNALGLVEYETGNGAFQVYPLFINEGKMIFRGRVFKGNNRIEDIKKDVKLNIR